MNLWCHSASAARRKFEANLLVCKDLQQSRWRCYGSRNVQVIFAQSLRWTMTPKPIENHQVAIVANGSIHSFEEMSERLRSFPHIIAADGGLLSCDLMKLTPDLIIGDMDSVSEELLAKYSHVEQKRYPEDKDETDVELAIEEAIAKNAKKVVIFGALERRIDHSVYNLHLLQRYPGILWIESEYESAFVINGHTEVKCFPKQVVSLLPLSEPVTGVTTKGLRWELNNTTFDKNFMSISNVCLRESFTVDLLVGNILCCLCKKG